MVALVSGVLLAALLVVLSTGWTSSRVGGFASDSSMVVDSAGGVHASFVDNRESSPYPRSLVYAQKGILGWSLAPAATLGPDEYIGSTSMAANSDGRTWIAYTVETFYQGRSSVFDDTVRVATNRDGSWAVIPVAGNGLAPSVAVGPDGRAYVAFIRLRGPQASGNLTLLRESGGAWVETVLGETDFGPDPVTQVAVDASGHLHVMFGTSFSFGYATNRSGTWRMTWFNSSQGGTSWYWAAGQSMVVDSEGNAYFAYESQDPVTGGSAVLYMTNAGGSWTSRVLDWESLAVSTAITLDGRGGVHVAYYDQENGTLKYATNAPGAWSTQVVGAANGGTVPLSIGVDPAGRVHMAYYASGGLGYATNGVDASNFAPFLAASFFWWAVPALVYAGSVYAVWAPPPRPPPRSS